MPAVSLLARLAVAAGASFLVAGTAAADEIEEALARIYADGRYQTELPLDAPAEPEEAEIEPIEVPALFALPGWLSEALVILLIAVAVGIVVAMAAGIRLRPSRRRDANGEETRDDSGEARPEGGERWLAQAEHLARGGRFAEAIHALLLAVLQILRERGQLSWRASATAREIARRARLPEGADTRLRDLVHQSELAHFGGRDADRARYERCRDGARDVVAAIGGAGA